MTATLIDALRLQFPASSRRSLMQWIEWGRVSVDGVVITKANSEVHASQTIELGKKEVDPQIGGLPVIYKDRWLIAINKPSNLLSYPTDSPDPNVVEILRDSLQTSSIFPVHRLDFETSGVLLFARGKEASQRMQPLFANHILERHYCAIVEGRMSQSEGTWEHYLREKENYDVEITTAEHGKKAITHFSVVRQSKLFTYLHLRLETGKKHQIRVQCADAGFPILGDYRYGSTCDPCKRLCLHARLLRFIHPFAHKEVTFIAPMPAPFQHLGFSDASFP